jgi:hypothetical protein
MKPPPRIIDNAEVLEYAWSDIPFGVLKDGEGKAVDSIHGLAICRYLGSDVVYRFSCDKNWETSQDADYSSLEQAKAELPEQYKTAPIDWRIPTNGKQSD